MINLKVVKSVDRSYVFMGISNKIRYSIIVNNVGDERANCVKVKDILSKGACCLPETLTVDGCKVEWSSCDDEIIIDCIDAGGNAVISFDAEIIQDYSVNLVTNKVRVSWADRYGNVSIIESDEIGIPVININVCLKKVVDKSIAKVGEIVSYSVLIRNNSNIDITNVVFNDTLPQNLSLLPSSVLVGSEIQYIDTFNGGIAIGDIKANSGIVISFQAEVMYMTSPCVINNFANVNYYYTVYDKERPVTSIGESTSNCVKTKILAGECDC